MKALRCHTFGAPDVLTIADLPTPIPAENEALIRIEAASIKPSDVKNVAGAMSQATLPLPRTPGRDYARVVEVGPSDLADFYHNETRLFGVDTLKMDLTDAAEVLEHLRPDFDSGDYRPAPIARIFRLTEAVTAYKAGSAGGSYCGPRGESHRIAPCWHGAIWCDMVR